MQNRAVKFIGDLLWILLSFLMLLEAWLFVSLKVNFAFYILIFSFLVLFLIIRLFYARIKELEKANTGFAHVLEKSEKSRINAEGIKNKISLIIDGLPEGLLIVAKDNNILSINSRAEKFLEIDRRLAINRQVSELEKLSDAKKIVLPLLAALKAVPNDYPKEEIEVDENFILDMIVEPLVFAKNNVAKLVILHDITKIKKTQRAENRFISMTVHQLKTPLADTKLSLKMLLENDFGKITKKQKSILEKTYQKNESLIYLVEDLLKEAKIDETESADEKTLINLADLTDSVLTSYKEKLEQKEINLKFGSLDKKMPEVMADQKKIKMVIQNLVDNAVKYTPEKGKIEINITPKKEEIEFSIKDSGIGIPEDQKEKIFKRFFRAVNVEKTEALGSGLGLSIAKEFIENHRGKIWFESKENKGSTFFFSLPVEE